MLRQLTFLFYLGLLVFNSVQLKASNSLTKEEEKLLLMLLKKGGPTVLQNRDIQAYLKDANTQADLDDHELYIEYFETHHIPFDLNNGKVEIEKKKDVNFLNANYIYNPIKGLLHCNPPAALNSSINPNPEIKEGKYYPKETLKDPLNDKRKEVVCPSTWPYALHGKLVIQFPSATQEIIGTGTLVGPSHVLTAGHCIYDKARGGNAKKISFIYAAPSNLNGKSGEWRTVNSKYAFTVTGWSKESKPSCDFGMLVLNEPVEVGGFMGITARTAHELEDQYINVSGFPTTLQKSHAMFHSFGTIKNFCSSILQYDIDVTEGQSGSALWFPEGKALYSVGIHTQGFDLQEQNPARRVNKGVCFSQKHLTKIVDWIEQTDQKGN